MKTEDLTLYFENNISKRLFIARFGRKEDYSAMAEELETLISEAIAEHEASKWHYDKQFPFNTEILVETEYGFFTAHTETSNLDIVIRWCELPAPYREKGGER